MKTIKLVIEVNEEKYRQLKFYVEQSAFVEYFYNAIANGIPLEDFLKQRKEPIDKSVIEAYLKENKTIVLTDKQFDIAKMLSTKNDFTDELRTIIKCDDFFEGGE